MLIRLLRSIPLLATGLAEKTNGKKTFIGLATTVIGIAMFFIPLTEGLAVETAVTGLTMTIGGLTHKAIKAAKKRKK